MITDFDGEAGAPEPVDGPGGPVLTRDDTWCIWLDSYGMRRYWASVVDETLVVRDPTDAGGDEVLDWSVTLVEDESGEQFAVDHNTLLTAMQRMVSERDTIQVAESIVDDVAAVLDSTDHDSATDELAQLDAIGTDVIIQIATLGNVIYG